MAKKPTVTTLQSGFNSTEVLNSNFEKLRDAFDNTLSLDGSTPNAMEADLDLNGNNIIGATGLLINGIDYVADVEAAKAAKDAALVAQSAASASATASANSATASASSATASAASATTASASETAAATSETNAAASAATATTKASEASTSATAAATSETNAATSEANAATSEANASTSETNAASSASAASASQVAAAASAASAANSYDVFDDRYLGSAASDPTLDNDGDPLVAGSLYFNSSANEMRVYDGANWIAASSAGGASLLNYNYTATSGQTTFSGADDNAASLSYTQQNLIVTLNGIVLEDGTDYTASNGTSIVLASGAAAGDELNVVAFKSFTTADMVPASTGGTFSGNVTVSADLTVGSNALFVDESTGDISFYEDTGTTPKFFWDASEENLGIGGASTFTSGTNIEVMDANVARLGFTNTSTNGSQWAWFAGTSGQAALYDYDNSRQAMTIDSSGNLLVGKTSQTGAGVGIELEADGTFYVGKTGDVATFNRTTSVDGTLIDFQKQGSTVGSIGFSGRMIMYGTTGSTGAGWYFGSNVLLPVNNSGVLTDNVIDLGQHNIRFDDVYATNGTIQTSDRNEKQDIEALSDAEQRVAVACKGLLRKFRWKDAVAEKGDDARIHFGIIAQDLQDAFTAEGLDAGRYAMFISTTWWETQTDVPAVEAVAEVLDEDGNVVTEAVEAKDAYTRTDTYETLEEAPEGATERTRLGVRYPELLAFIIGAM